MKKNKEWLKEELTKQIDILHTTISSGNYVKLVKRAEIMGLIDQLDEPELPVIPQFVADWIEINKNIEIDYAFELIKNRAKSGKLDEFDNWVNKNKKMFAIAFVAGYAIEKEPEKLYRVKFPNVTKHGNEMYLEKNDGEDITSIDWSPKDFVENEDSDDYHFTEQEIKAIDERYWAFREEVPNV